jgi:hypothetical protein
MIKKINNQKRVNKESIIQNYRVFTHMAQCIYNQNTTRFRVFTHIPWCINKLQYFFFDGLYIE